MKLTNGSKPKWERIIVAIICLAGIMTIARGSYAAYTSQAFQRGVVRNRDNEVVRFSSNYLQNCSENSVYGVRDVLFSEEQKKSGESLPIDIFIYNYANGNKSLVNQKDITYDMTISFSNGDGKLTDYSVIKDDDNTKIYNPSGDNKTCTFSEQVLTGRAAKWHKYTIKFPASDIDKLQITAVATPHNLSVTNYQKLAVIITPSIGSATNTFSYKNEFIYDPKVTNPQLYDGFNYEVSISSGKVNATLEWDSNALEIDKFFLINLGKKDEGDEIKTILQNHEITFQMDQSAGTGDYLIPFYIKNKEKIPKSWDEMSKLITFKVEKIQ